MCTRFFFKLDYFIETEFEIRRYKNNPAIYVLWILCSALYLSKEIWTIVDDILPRVDFKQNDLWLTQYKKGASGELEFPFMSSFMSFCVFYNTKRRSHFIYKEKFVRVYVADCVFASTSLWDSVPVTVYNHCHHHHDHHHRYHHNHYHQVVLISRRRTTFSLCLPLPLSSYVSIVHRSTLAF